MVYEKLDQVVNIDYNDRSIDKLYQAAREKFGVSLTEKAAEMILELPKDRFVFLLTGSITRPWVTPQIGETDGPLGTAILAKAIRNSRSVIPVIITEETLVDSIIPVINTAGLRVVSIEEALSAQENISRGYTNIACVLSFPTTHEAAKVRTKNLIKEMNPATIISVEKAGQNVSGVYHNMRGADTSKGRGRFDYLIDEAREQGILTIGIGDGGNEIGMGCVIDAVKEHVPYGKKCQCPCTGGIASTTETDLLVPGSVSNWACYAISAALAVKTKDTNLLPSIEDEKRMINAAILSGHVDGATGKAEPTVDGFSLEANCSIINIIRAIALKELK